MDPAKRQRAFNNFERVLLVEPRRSDETGAGYLDSYGYLKTETLRLPTGEVRYLISWSHHIPTGGWPEEIAERKAEGTLQPGDGDSTGFYQVIDTSGNPIGTLGMLGDQVVSDLTGDGTPEVVERHFEERGEHFAEWLTVEALGGEAPPELIILYNTQRVSLDSAKNTWSFQVLPASAGTPATIEIGPAKVPGGVEPKVRFQWDSATASWIQIPKGTHDHFQRIALSDGESVAASLEAGGLPYSPDFPSLDRFTIPSPEPSKPRERSTVTARKFQYQSLLGAPDRKMVEYFAIRPTRWDVEGARSREPDSLALLRKQPPREAALQLVSMNLSPETRGSLILDFLQPPATAPEEGEITIYDNHSGCFAPWGRIIFHLTCSKNGSSLTYASRAWEWWPVLLPTTPPIYDFRRITLSAAEARHAFQTLWWLSRMRSRCINPKASLAGGSCTSDGFAEVRLSWVGGESTIEGERFCPHPDRHVAEDSFSVGYTPSSFVSVVSKAFQDTLATCVANQNFIQRSGAEEDGRRALTPIGVDAMRSKTREFLSLYLAKKVPTVFALLAMEAAGEYGWSDLESEIKQVGAAPAPRSKPIEHYLDTQREIEALKSSYLPQEISLAARGDRSRRAAPSPQPGELSYGESVRPPALTQAEKERFGKIDKLMDSAETQLRELGEYVADGLNLREASEEALRMLAVRDSPEALERWSSEGEAQDEFILRRLLVLDPARLPKVWKKRELEDSTNKGKPTKDPYFILFKLMGPKGTEPQKLDADGIEMALESLANPEAELTLRKAALSALVPKQDPLAYSDSRINETLLSLLAGPNSLPLDSVSSAAAVRMGQQAWTPILEATKVQLKKANWFSDTALLSLTRLSFTNSTELLPTLLPLFDAALINDRSLDDDVVWALWIADLRNLEPQLTRQATAGIDEGEGIYDLPKEGDAETDRVLHAARHLASIWAEPDAFTRARMEIAFVFVNAERAEADPEPVQRMVFERIRKTASSLTAPERAELLAFLSYCSSGEGSALLDSSDGNTGEAVTRLSARIRQSIEGPGLH